MKFADVKDLSAVDVNKKIREVKEKIFESKMKNAMGQLSNPASLRVLRRDIARLKTALTTKMAEAAKSAPKAAPKAPAKKAKSAVKKAKGA